MDEPRQRKNLLAGIIFRYRHNEICRSVGTLFRQRMYWRSGSIQNRSNAPWMSALGIDSILGQRSQDRVQNDQCACRNGRYGAIVPPGLQKMTLSDSGGRILRVQEKVLEAKILCICRSLGRLVTRKENGCTCTIVTGEPNEFVREIHTRNAGHSATTLGYPERPAKRSFFPSLQIA
jgi:hypothetical protein